MSFVVLRIVRILFSIISFGMTARLYSYKFFTWSSLIRLNICRLGFATWYLVFLWFCVFSLCIFLLERLFVRVDTIIIHSIHVLVSVIWKKHIGRLGPGKLIYQVWLGRALTAFYWGFLVEQKVFVIIALGWSPHWGHQASPLSALVVVVLGMRSWHQLLLHHFKIVKNKFYLKGGG